MAAQGKLEFAALAHGKSGKRNGAGNVGVDVLGAGKSGLIRLIRVTQRFHLSHYRHYRENGNLLEGGSGFPLSRE